jgi:hypothetical protein
VNDSRADQELADALDACLRAMAAGESLAAVLERFPDQRAALLPLLNVASAVRATPPPPPLGPGARQSIRARLLANLEPVDTQTGGASAQPILHPATWLRGWPRWRVAALRGAAAMGLIALLVSATVSASAAALPGEPFYGVKRAAEEAQLSLAADGEQRAGLRLELADRRLDEAVKLVAKGDVGRAEETVVAAQAQVEAATAVMTATATAPAVQSLARQFEQRLGQRRQQMERSLPLVDEGSRANLERAVDQPLQLLEQLVPPPTPTPPSTPTPPPTPTRQPTATLTVPPTARPPTAVPPEGPSPSGAPPVGAPETSGSASAGSGAPDRAIGPPLIPDEGAVGPQGGPRRAAIATSVLESSGATGGAAVATPTSGRSSRVAPTTPMGETAPEQAAPLPAPAEPSPRPSRDALEPNPRPTRVGRIAPGTNVASVPTAAGAPPRATAAAAGTTAPAGTSAPSGAGPEPGNPSLGATPGGRSAPAAGAEPAVRATSSAAGGVPATAAGVGTGAASPAAPAEPPLAVTSVPPTTGGVTGGAPATPRPQAPAGAGTPVPVGPPATSVAPAGPPPAPPATAGLPSAATPVPALPPANTDAPPPAPLPVAPRPGRTSVPLPPVPAVPATVGRSQSGAPGGSGQSVPPGGPAGLPGSGGHR